MLVVSYLVFLAGIMLAISAAAKLPVEGQTYPDTWPTFVIGAVVAAFGIVLWRVGLSRDATRSMAGQPDRDPLTLLADLLPPIHELASDAGRLNQVEFANRVELLLETYVLPFAEVRRGVIDHFGMSTGADILVTAAFGERMLNRAWSAAADGYLTEARNCLPEAIHAFEEANRIAQAKPGSQRRA